MECGESETGFLITAVQNTLFLLASAETAFPVAGRRLDVPQLRDKYPSFIFSTAEFSLYFLVCHCYTIGGSLCVLTSMIFKSSNHIISISAEEGTLTWSKNFQTERCKNSPGFQELPCGVIMHLYSIRSNLYFKEKGKIIPPSWLVLCLCKHRSTSFSPPSPSLICQLASAKGLLLYPKNSAPPGAWLNPCNDNGLGMRGLLFYHFLLFEVL